MKNAWLVQATQPVSKIKYEGYVAYMKPRSTNKSFVSIDSKNKKTYFYLLRCFETGSTRGSWFLAVEFSGAFVDSTSTSHDASYQSHSYVSHFLINQFASSSSNTTYNRQFQH
ncbi:hypothetical protein GQ600_17235 [Phytophthora cactorum]|nr:hypothetical protein GQ600_17235 [Phytophthora cactorum]